MIFMIKKILKTRISAMIKGVYNNYVFNQRNPLIT
jgi:hypothetical protein